MHLRNGQFGILPLQFGILPLQFGSTHARGVDCLLCSFSFTGFAQSPIFIPSLAPHPTPPPDPDPYPDPPQKSRTGHASLAWTLPKTCVVCSCSDQQQENGVSAPHFSTDIDSILEDLQASQLCIMLLHIYSYA